MLLEIISVIASSYYASGCSSANTKSKLLKKDDEIQKMKREAILANKKNKWENNQESSFRKGAILETEKCVMHMAPCDSEEGLEYYGKGVTGKAEDFGRDIEIHEKAKGEAGRCLYDLHKLYDNSIGTNGIDEDLYKQKGPSPNSFNANWWPNIKIRDYDSKTNEPNGLISYYDEVKGDNKFFYNEHAKKNKNTKEDYKNKNIFSICKKTKEHKRYGKIPGKVDPKELWEKTGDLKQGHAIYFRNLKDGSYTKLTGKKIWAVVIKNDKKDRYSYVNDRSKLVVEWHDKKDNERYQTYITPFQITEIVSNLDNENQDCEKWWWGGTLNNRYMQMYRVPRDYFAICDYKANGHGSDCSDNNCFPYDEDCSSANCTRI